MIDRFLRSFNILTHLLETMIFLTGIVVLGGIAFLVVLTYSIVIMIGDIVYKCVTFIYGCLTLEKTPHDKFDS